MGSTDSQPDRQPAEARQLGLWARRYAQTRTLSFVVFLGLLTAVNVGILGLSLLGGWALRNGQAPLFWLCLAGLVPIVLALVWLAIPRYAAILQRRINERFYAHEGEVMLRGPDSKIRMRIAYVAAGLFGACILATVLWGDAAPVRYEQPISALYVVPFLVTLSLLMRPAGSPWLLAWPILYGLHAVLITLGAPIVWTGAWTPLNLLVPIAGYGLLAGLLSHAYSRFALHRIKTLAQPNQLEETEPSGE